MAALLVVLAVPISSTDAGADETAGPRPLAVESAVAEPTAATPVRLWFGDDERLVETRAATIGSLLIEQGIVVFPGDEVYPPTDTPVNDGLVVGLTLIRDFVLHEDEPIYHRAELSYDYSVPLGQKVVVQVGANGAARRSYQVRTVNDVETSRELLSEETIPPTNQVVRIGLSTEKPLPPPGEGMCRSTMPVWATYYTAVSAGGTVTRTGTGVFKGIVAVDPNVIPLGARMYVPGYGYGVAADTGGGVIGAHVDLAYGANDVYDWGSRNIEICLLD
ncbi:MAG TPA: G5 domain-containing protein [Dehalococcoidia bacterium]